MPSLSQIDANVNLQDRSNLKPKKVTGWRKFLGNLEEELDDSSDKLTVAKVRRRASVSTGQASLIVSNDVKWQKVRESLRNKRAKQGLSLKTVLQNALRERMHSKDHDAELSDGCVDGRFDDAAHLKVPFAVMTDTSAGSTRSSPSPPSMLQSRQKPVLNSPSTSLSQEDLFVILRTASEITDEVMAGDLL